MNRLPSSLSLSLVRAMATDPASPKGLREFHARQLADLERRAAIARRGVRESPFSRFIEALENEPETPKL